MPLWSLSFVTVVTVVIVVGGGIRVGAAEDDDVARRSHCQTVDVPVLNAFDDSMRRWRPQREQNSVVIQTRLKI